jgi:hypothetical protein
MLQLSRNPFDRDPFRKKQQIAVTGGEEVLGASADTTMKAREIIRTLEEIQELSKQHKEE